MEAAVVHRGKAYIRDGLGIGDNNQAEWLALLFAVELASAQHVRDVLFVGDSQLVIHQASGTWQCRSDQLAPYLAAFNQAKLGFARVRLRHVARTKNLAGIALARRFLP